MRTAGILFPVFSLPSQHGIGTLGKAAYDFVDFLSAAGQTEWQILPMGPTGYGDSPYQSFSAMAGNPYFIDLDLLVGNKLLLPGEIGAQWGESETHIDYNLLFNRRFKVLALACARQDKHTAEYRAFCEQNKDWLDDYALFMALKEAHKQAGLSEWPEALRRRNPAALRLAKAKWAGRIEFWRCIQFFFYQQWVPLKQYANARGIRLVGDIPIYVSPDSSDLWANPDLFMLDQDGNPSMVAGVPPDAFSADGQLWGNPLYNWKHHKRSRFAWWISRMRHAATMFDITRIDHFRGFASFYAIPAGSKTAATGSWMPGPGKGFVKALRRGLPDIQIIAEDLGFLTEDVFELLRYSGYPGMKILQFAFDSREESDYLPHNYTRHSVVYTGTHDNTTTEDWQQSAAPADVAMAREYFNLEKRQSLTDAMIYAALGSVADTAIIPIGDWLHLGAEGRINTPSTLGGNNWCWRAKPGQLTPALAAKIRRRTQLYGRLSQVEKIKDQYKAAMEAAAAEKQGAEKPSTAAKP